MKYENMLAPSDFSGEHQYSLIALGEPASRYRKPLRLISRKPTLTSRRSGNAQVLHFFCGVLAAHTEEVD